MPLCSVISWLLISFINSRIYDYVVQCLYCWLVHKQWLSVNEHQKPARNAKLQTTHLDIMYLIFMIEVNLYVYFSVTKSVYLKFWMLQIPPSRLVDPSEIAQFLPLVTSCYEKLILPSTKLETDDTTALIWIWYVNSLGKEALGWFSFDCKRC